MNKVYSLLVFYSFVTTILTIFLVPHIAIQLPKEAATSYHAVGRAYGSLSNAVSFIHEKTPFITNSACSVIGTVYDDTKSIARSKYDNTKIIARTACNSDYMCKLHLIAYFIDYKPIPQPTNMSQNRFTTR